jgi:DNA replication protein DnaC
MGSLSNWITEASGGRDLVALAEHAPPTFNRRGGWTTNGQAHRLERLEEEFDRRLPARFRHAVADDPRVLEWIGLHQEDPQKHSHLLLMGNTGSGKTTHLVGAIRKITIDAVTSGGRAPSFLYVTHGQVARRMRDFRDDAARELFEQLCTVDILAFDELGSVPGREWGIEWLTDLVDTRYRECKTLMTATNKSFRDLNEMLGDDRIVSRLLEDRNTIKMVRDDLRLQKRGFIE